MPLFLAGKVSSLERDDFKWDLFPNQKLKLKCIFMHSDLYSIKYILARHNKPSNAESDSNK